MLIVKRLAYPRTWIPRTLWFGFFHTLFFIVKITDCNFSKKTLLNNLL